MKSEGIERDRKPPRYVVYADRPILIPVCLLSRKFVDDVEGFIGRRDYGQRLLWIELEEVCPYALFPFPSEIGSCCGIIGHKPISLIVRQGH